MDVFRDSDIYDFLSYLMQKYPIEGKATIQIDPQYVEYWEYDNGVRIYGQANDMGNGYVYIFIAMNAKEDLLLVLAHEFCHVLQWYIWETCPTWLEHPDLNDPLEIQAHKFAKDEVELYRNCFI